MLFNLKTALSTIQTPLYAKNPDKILIACPFCGGTMLADNKRYTCYDCCKTGNIVDFIAERDHTSHKKAALRAEKDKPSKETLDEIYRCNELAARFFEEQKSECKYLAKRMISNKTSAAFRLGYAPLNSEALLEYLKAKDISDEVMIEARLCNDEFRPFFRNRAMFPITDEFGRIVGFGGRRITDDNPKTPKYLNSGENLVFHKKSVLFGLDKALGNDTVYIVEGYMDVIALYQAGITNAVAALGTAIGISHCTLLRDMGVKNVILCMDSDEAGIKSIIRSIPILRNYFTVNVVRLSGAKDPDEYITLNGKESFMSLDRISGDSFWVEHCDEKQKYSIALDCLL